MQDSPASSGDGGADQTAAGRAPTPTTIASNNDATPAELRRCIAGSAIGNATEWFDYGAYGYVALILEDVFFPGHGYVGVALGFAVSFVLRPLGGLFWGPLGDRIGRQKVLALTIILMAGATFLVGCLPTYSQVGWLAIALLLVLRVVQGFSTGGEYGGAATYMAEHAPDNRRGFYGSFLEFGTIAGFTLAVVISTILSNTLSDAQMHAWGWRVLFWVGGPLGLIGMYVRSKLEETPVFRELEQESKVEEGARNAFKDLLTLFWRPILTLAGMVIALNVINYTLLTYMATYFEKEAGFSAGDAGNVMTIGYAIMMVFLPICGAISDKVGRKAMWYFSLSATIILAIPMFILIGKGFWPALIGFAILGIVYVPQLATISATFPAMFPSQVRYSGMALTYNVFTAAFGGTALYVNDALIGATGDNLVPAYYMMAAAVVGLVAVIFLVETAGKSLRGTELPGTEEQEKELADMTDAATA